MKQVKNSPDCRRFLEQDSMAEEPEFLSPNALLEEAIDQERSKRHWMRFLIEIAVVILVVLLIFQTVIGISKVSGDSMKPALETGDRILYFRLARNFEAGDIILFRTDAGELLVKRIIAVEGDSVYIDPKKKDVYIDGLLKEEPYTYSDTKISESSVEYPVLVEVDHFFVMGDNREASKDSRDAEIGQVSKEQIIGKVVFLMRGI